MAPSPATASPTSVSSDWKPTACILCECNCGLEVQLGGDDGRRLLRFRGDDAHPASKGYACEKPGRLDFYQNGAHRLHHPLRRRADGSFEEISWETAIAEVATRLAAIRDTHGGDTILYYGGGGQGNHLPGAYSRATRAALGMKFQSSALAQEKTGEFFVSGRIFGGVTRSDFATCEVALFIGKNPWLSHGIPHARLTLREIAKDPARTLIVIDPRRSETAELADIHLAVRPGCDAYLLQALIGVVVQEDLLAREWLAAHAVGVDEVLPYFAELDIAELCRRCGLAEEVVRETARRIAGAQSVASYEDLGVQMNQHSTLVSYLHKLLILLTGHFAKPGTAYRPSSIVPLFGSAGPRSANHRSPVTGSRILGGLMACNVIPEEILTDHPRRFRALICESGNPAHSLADSARMREALAALELVVVIDVALTETARCAHYVLPVASQFEKAEATFFNFEFPHNYFHLRRPLLPPPAGLFSEAELHARLLEALGVLPKEPVAALRAAWQQGREVFRKTFFQLAAAHPEAAAMAPILLYRAIGDLLPAGCAEGAALWVICQQVAPRYPAALERAGFSGPAPIAADALFDALIDHPRGVVFAVDAWEENWSRVNTASGRLELAIPELLPELAALQQEAPPSASPEFPFILSAGERRQFTANTIFRNPEWRKKDRGGALRIHPDDARELGLAEGSRARIVTRRGSAEAAIELSDRMQRGHVSLPNGHGLEASDGDPRVGVAPNELTRAEDRDWLAGTPWHKFTPARIEAAR